MEEEIKFYKQMYFGVKSDGTTEMLGRNSEEEPWKVVMVIKPKPIQEKPKKESFWKKMLTIFIS